MATLTAKEIYNDVKMHIFDLMRKGEMDIVFGDYIHQVFNVYLKGEHTVEVEYFGDSVRESFKDINNEDVLARAIMRGFARLYLNKDKKNEGKMHNRGKRKIAIREGEFNKVITSAVMEALNEVGDTPEGQQKLGALHARKVINNPATNQADYESNLNDYSNIHTYARKQREKYGDDHDELGNVTNDRFTDYANGYVDYLNSHMNDLAASDMRRRRFESKLNRVVTESIKKALMESDEFNPTGYMTKSNWGGTEVEIHPSGDSARFRDNYGGEPSKPTDWMEIQFDEDGVAYVQTDNGTERLDQYMRY